MSSNAPGGRNPENPAESLEMLVGEQVHLKNPVESPVMLLGAETLETLQKA